MKVKSNFMGNDTKIKANTIAMVDNNKGIPLDEYLGNLTNLKTASKANVVSAINSLKPVVLFEGSISGANTITLNDSRDNYEYIEVYACTGDGGDVLVPVVKVPKSFNKFQIVFNTSPSTGWINMNIDYEISGTTISPIALRQAYINTNKIVERITLDLASYGWNLRVLKILGYK